MVVGKVLVEVDHEHINLLRRTGFSYEADQLVRAHQRTIKKNYKDGKRIIHNEVVKINQFHWRRKGLCISCGNERDHKRWLTCDSCREKMRERYHKEKEKGVD